MLVSNLLPLSLSPLYCQYYNLVVGLLGTVDGAEYAERVNMVVATNCMDCKDCVYS